MVSEISMHKCMKEDILMKCQKVQNGYQWCVVVKSRVQTWLEDVVIVQVIRVHVAHTTVCLVSVLFGTSHHYILYICTCCNKKCIRTLNQRLR